ncbi:MAG: hypothetical protein ACRDB0_00525 [Paraclostridium sp.]
MLNNLAKNQYVKISKDDDSVEYGVVLNVNNNKYDIMSVGFENKNGRFIEYPPNVENFVQSYNINDANFDEVKKNEIRRDMNIWMEKYNRR